MSKIELAKNLIKLLPKPVNKGYVLEDSWYSCKALFTAATSVVYTYVGALKTIRVIYPKSHNSLGIKLHKFSSTLDIDDFDLVTVKNKEYYIYNFVSNLEDIKNVSIIFSYPKDAFKKDGALKTFISLDASLSALEILNQYSDRWSIEPFFRDCKSYLGLDGYQIRNEKSINRYLLIILINYTYCKLYCNDSYHFNTGFRLAQNNLEKSKVIWIYYATTSGKPVEKILEYLKIAE